MPDRLGTEHEVAERVRKKVEKEEFAGIAEKPLRITISEGIEATHTMHCPSMSFLIRRAKDSML